MGREYDRSEVIGALVKLGKRFAEGSEDLDSAINHAYAENAWFTPENYRKALKHWSGLLSEQQISQFIREEIFTESPKKVGIIMAGNIPMVGFHDLLCVLLSGHLPVIKPSNSDQVMMKYVCGQLNDQLGNAIEVTEMIKGEIDAVIATGSNNSFRYFEYYFSKIPNLLRRNRRSIAILDGTETDEELLALGDDVLSYFGLGCRNVSLIFIPQSYDITYLLDQLRPFEELINHNKYANNYTYHKALFLMNSQPHLDTGYMLVKEDRSLKAPIGVIYVARYNDLTDISHFLDLHKDEIQCLVGKLAPLCSIPFGKAQYPDLQDYADHKNTIQFLSDI